MFNCNIVVTGKNKAIIVNNIEKIIQFIKDGKDNHIEDDESKELIRLNLIENNEEVNKKFEV